MGQNYLIKDKKYILLYYIIMPTQGEFFFPCIICCWFILTSIIFFITYYDNKTFFDDNEKIKGGLWTGYVFYCITLLFVILTHLITTCDVQSDDKTEIAVPILITTSAFITLLTLGLTYHYNKDIFDTKPRAHTGFWASFILFFIIILFIIPKTIIKPKCDNGYNYTFNAFLP